MFSFVPAVGLAMLPACGSPTQCVSCAEQALHVVVPPAELGQILAVTTSDVACAGAAVSCAVAADGGACEDYRIVPVAKGNCHVDVDLGAGTRFSADVKIVQTTGCCAGLYADPASAAVIEVP
jgi:hypothetical protein